LNCSEFPDSSFFIGAVLVLQNNTFGGKIQTRKEHMFGKGERKNYFLKPIDNGEKKIIMKPQFKKIPPKRE
jgi:hypothetical protein